MTVHTLNIPKKDYSATMESYPNLELLITKFWEAKNYPALMGVTLTCVLFQIDVELQDEMYFLNDIIDDHMEGYSTTLIKTAELARIKEFINDAD